MTTTITKICDECGKDMSNDSGQKIEKAEHITSKGTKLEIQLVVASVSNTDTPKDICDECRTAILKNLQKDTSKFTSIDLKELNKINIEEVEMI